MNVGKNMLKDFLRRNKLLDWIVVILILIACFGIFTIVRIVKNLESISQASYTKTPYYPPYPTIDTAQKTATEIALIERGAYLAKAGDCIACHTNTDQRGASFAG